MLLTPSLNNNEDIEALLSRRYNIMALSAGVVLQNKTFISAQSWRSWLLLEGISIKNPVSGGRQVTLSQDALEEIRFGGGYTAEFGNSNSGIIRTQLKSGTPDLKASYEYYDILVLKAEQRFRR